MDLNSILGRDNKDNTRTIIIIAVLVVVLLAIGNGNRNASPTGTLSFGSFNVGGSPYNDVGFINRPGGCNPNSGSNLFFIVLIVALIILLSTEDDDHGDD